MTAKDRSRLLQARTNEALDLYAGTLVATERLMTSLAMHGGSPDDVAQELLHYQQAAGPELVNEVADAGYRFLARSLLLAAEYGTDSLLRLVPAEQLPRVGAPPPPPALPAPSDPSAWFAWFGAFAGWSVRHSTWSARVYELVRGEVLAQRLPPAVLRDATDDFLRERLVDYLQDSATAQVELLADNLAAGQNVVRQLLATLTGEPASDDLTIAVQGPTGGRARTEFAIENNRAEPAVVDCTGASLTGYALAVAPARLTLEPGQAARVGIVLDLPDADTGGTAVPAALVTVAGPGFGQLVVHVHATVTAAPRPQIAVRVLDSPGWAAAPD